jgi:hypothetical protein
MLFGIIKPDISDEDKKALEAMSSEQLRAEQQRLAAEAANPTLTTSEYATNFAMAPIGIGGSIGAFAGAAGGSVAHEKYARGSLLKDPTAYANTAKPINLAKLSAKDFESLQNGSVLKDAAKNLSYEDFIKKAKSMRIPIIGLTAVLTTAVFSLPEFMLANKSDKMDKSALDNEKISFVDKILQQRAAKEASERVFGEAAR